ncbi:MAG: PAS domain S-box protein, partial [Verrucomicrobiae bacterium]|nr:PAS domain S-box protein [Verrucomicrobiae bacterium]
MDYAVFLTGLFLLTAGLGCIFLFRKDAWNTRWISLMALFVSLAFGAWHDIVCFAFSIAESLQLAKIFFGAAFAMSALGFVLSPLFDGRRAPFIMKWASVVALFGITFISGAGNPSSPFYIIPVLGAALAAGWRLPGSTHHVPGLRRIGPPLVTACLLVTAAAICVLPGFVETAHDIQGLGASPRRIARLALIAASCSSALALCLILWRALYQEERGEFSRDLLRRRCFGTRVILAAAVFTLGNGAWLAHWLGHQAGREQIETLLSALNLGADNLDADRIQSIEGRPEELTSPPFQKLRGNLVRIREALPGARFVYLLGIRDERLVFLADAEDPSYSDTFSPPGEEVEGYPDEWREELAGKPTFSGPESDRWGVWYSASIPVRDSAGELIALLGVDYPAAVWLKPLAARRFAAMGVTLSIALLLVSLFGFHLRSIETAHHVESLSERLSDAMTAADFDTWECQMNPFHMRVGAKIARTLGWTGVNARPCFRKVWRTVHPEDRRQLFGLIRQSGTPEAEVRLRNSEGRWIWFMVRGRIVLSHAGTETARLVGTILDIDERHRSRLEIDRQRRFAQQVMESVPNGLAVLDADGLISYANPAFMKLAGTSRRTLAGMPIGRLLPDAGGQRGCGSGCESVLARFDGGLVPVNVFRAPLSEASQGCESILALVDLTAAKEVERDLLRSRAEANRLALVAKRTDNAVVITDASGRIEWVNEGFSKISGYSREEVIGRTPGSILQRPGSCEPARVHMRERIRAGCGFETEVLNYAKCGRAYHVHIECQPLVDKHGKLTGFMAIERDITQQRRSSRLLEAVA